MGDIVNLRRARKARDRAADATRAASQRAAHGRIKAEKMVEAAERLRRDALLDAVKRSD